MTKTMSVRDRHSYSWLPQRCVKNVIAIPDRKNSAPHSDADWILDLYEDGEHYTKMRDLKRSDVLVILACLGHLEEGGRSLQYCLDIAEEIRKEVTCEYNDLVYRGARMEIFHDTDGRFFVELEPGQGMTVTRITVTAASDAHNVVMGLLDALRDRYLVRAIDTTISDALSTAATFEAVREAEEQLCAFADGDQRVIAEVAKVMSHLRVQLMREDPVPKRITII
jgi:hypothetical protein